MKYSYLLLLFLGLGKSLQAQEAGKIAPPDIETLAAYEDTMALMGYAVINDSIQEHRFGTCKKLITTLKTALQVENSFNYPFEKVKSVSIQYPQDSTFRIFTWQLYVDKDEYRYFGAIQMNTSELSLIPLIDRSFDFIGSMDQKTYGADNWYGAVYYRIMEVDAPKEKYYLVFGFDGFEFFQRRKFVDVLTFDEQGQAQFGAPVFVSEEKGIGPSTKNRIFLEYSAEASVKLNYDETLEKIIFDNLMMINGQYGEGPTSIPDGTYQGYELRDGVWIHVPKVFHEIMDEPPVPQPKLGADKKDLFGNDQWVAYLRSMQEHSLTVSRTARYYTLGQPGPQIKSLWLVCHGYGQLASRIIQKFDSFDDGNTLVVAPEGLSRFYWQGVTGEVAASWMTKADRLNEIEDYSNYLSQLYEKIRQDLPEDLTIYLFGFSQGCATQVRWITRKFPHFHHLILWAGFFPEDLNYLPYKDYFSDKKCHLIYGDEDQYLTPERLQMHEQLLKNNELTVEVTTFSGKHVINRKILNELKARIQCIRSPRNSNSSIISASRARYSFQRALVFSSPQ